MYKALNYWVFGGFGPNRTPYEFIDFAVEMELDGVELTVGDAISPDISEAECVKIRDYAKSKGIGLRTLATGFYWGCSLSSEDAAERATAMDFTRKYLQLAAWLGVETVLLVPGATCVGWDDSRPIQSYASVWQKSVVAIKEISILAEKLGVNVGLENVWNQFLLSPMEWKLYLEQFESERIGIYFDVGNCCYIGRPQDYVEILGDKIKAVHLKNFSGSDCAGGMHGFGDDLMTGDVDFTAVFATLNQIGYRGPLTAEMIPFSRLPDLVLPDQELAEKTARQLKAL